MPEPLKKLREYAEEHGLPLYGAMIVLAIVTVSILVVLFVPHWEVQHALNVARNNPALKTTLLLGDSAKQLELEDNFRKTIVQGLGGAIVLLGLYYSARTFGLSRQGHITDRFTKAVEQLGKVDGNKPNIEVRLGAIYALERIAIDSPRDHWTIMEVLTAYVRQNAPLDPGRPYAEGEKPRTDIQAILTVLGRRKIGLTRERPVQRLERVDQRLDQRLDLSSSRLCGANLYRPNLTGANLAGANLQDANLQGAELAGAILNEANLQGADLDRAAMHFASLRGANLQDANLQRAFLQYANLQGANLERANLERANLERANLERADLERADLPNASPQYVNLPYADLQYRIEEGWNLEQIKSAINWETADYSPNLRIALGLPPERDN